MKNYKGVWIPDEEQHIPYRIDLENGYQMNHIWLSLAFCTNFNTAIDIGANVGMWSRELSRHFKKVYAFEPVKEFGDCLVKNVPENVTLIRKGLSNVIGQAGMYKTTENCGESFIVEGSGIELVRLDDFNFKDVGLIKIDVEGFELFVVQGGVHTLLDNSPVICVEDKKHSEKYGIPQGKVLEELEKLGYKKTGRIHGDYIFIRE